MRVVIDTNVLVSAFFWSQSIPAKVLLKATDQSTLLFSIPTLAELIRVLERPKFHRYIKPVPSRDFVSVLLQDAEMVEINTSIQACRDPRDDIFLEAAVNGNADFIISGDEDLLEMHPFKGVKIMNPTEFLKHA